ncbi:MAG: methylmalonyl-CoA mutase, partial [Planctomycetes bacterium]|nr:methylmalonyl-CoA mutase [Planctomycetota bacterium]
PDHAMAEGEVGKVGVSIASLDDMEELLADIPLGEVSTSMTINATAMVLLALYVAVGKKQGVPEAKLSGTIQNDILKEYAARGTYRFPVGPSLRLITDIFSWCASHAPRFNTISISGYHMREAGCTAAQEVAFTLGNGIQYVQSAVDAGLDVDRFAGRLSFFFNAHNDLFEEVAKFRAARRMWARIMRERFHAKQDRSCMLRFHTQTAGSTLTSRQIDNNVVRVTVQALAAVLGGTQSLHTNSRDEALALPSEESAKLALRTQQVLAHESGVAQVVDPLGGSHFIETLTDQVEEAAQRYIQNIDDMGGAVRAIEQGYVQREIHRAAYETQKKIECGDDVVVGVNAFEESDEVKPALLRIDESVGARQVERLRDLRKNRDGAAVAKNLEALREAAVGDENLFPRVLACVEDRATLGEICTVLEGVFGTYREVSVL